MSLANIAFRNIRKGLAVKGLFGAVTGIDSELIPSGNASDLSDVDTEDGIAKPRRGFRNILPADANQSTMKGAHWCQIYTSGVLHEAFVTFDYDRGGSGKMRPYEMAYTLATDTWAKTEVTKGGVSLDLSNTYWRSACFGSKAYFINPNDSHPVNSYTVGTVTSWAYVEPPANPSTAPTVNYYLNPSSRAYAKYLGASASYAAGDVTADNTVADSTVTLASQAVRVTIKAAGHFTVTFNLKHSAASADFTYCDVFTMDVTVNDTQAMQVLLKSLKASLTSTTGPVTQELNVSVVSETNDSAGKLKSVKLYLKFAGKGTRATWATSSTLTIEGDVVQWGGSNDYLYFSPLVAGGMVDWGDKQIQLFFTRYESSTTFESGPSLAKNLDRISMDGQYLVPGGSLFPMGTVPLVTMTAASDSDYLRLYARTTTGKPSAWRRVVEQADGTLTYTFAIFPEDFAALTEYAPAGFTYTGVQNLFPFRQSMCWLYPGATNNVRFSRYNSPVAQASDSDAFRTDLGQDDDFRGVNFTLNGTNQDQPVCGLEIGGVALIFGSLGAYLVVDTMNGLPQGFTPPKPIPNALGIHGPDAFCVFEDQDGGTIVVYCVNGGDSWRAIRIPIGVTLSTVEAISAYEYSMLIRSSADAKEFAASLRRDPEATHVYAKGNDNSLHFRYNTHEIVSRRPDLIAGKRPWQFYSFNTGQYANQWQKVKCVLSSIGWLYFGFRLNGAVDEFEQANMKDPSSGDRMPMVDIDGSSRTPASLVAATDIATFTIPTPYATGTPGTFAETQNGVTAGTTYYYNRITPTTAYWYDTLAHAQAGGATGRINLTGSTWLAGAFTPLGPDDGSAYLTDPFWTSKTFYTQRRRVRKVQVDKVLSTDSVTVTVVSDRQTSSGVVVGSDESWAKFTPQQSGDRHKFKFTLSERHSGVRGFSTEEAELSQQRHK